MNTADWIQVAIAIVAAGAAGVALVVAAQDRRHATQIAETDRRAAAEREVLALKLDVAIRLTENLARGGSQDSEESKRLGAEALALITVLGPDYVPMQWAKRVGTAGDLEQAVQDTGREQWVRNKMEAGLAVQLLADELARLGQSGPREG